MQRHDPVQAVAHVQGRHLPGARRRWRGLLDRGVPIDFESLPTNQLRSRLNLCFGLIILITALMIGTMANQRAADIIRQPNNQN